jgi:polyhydroxyalkanoate synthesis regulator phasin
MPQQKQVRKQDKDLMTRLTGAGEEAVQRLGELPMGKALIDTAQSFRERLDELAARVRSIDPLEKRVTALEKRLAALERKERAGSRPARGKSSSSRSSSGAGPSSSP